MTKVKKILILSLSKVSEKSSRIIKETTTLKNAGYEPLVVSIVYPEQKEKEIIQGINFERVFLKSKKWSSSFVFQILKFFEFYSKATKRYRNFDIVDCHDLFTLIIGHKIAKKNKAKLILNAHELETERNGESKFRKKIMKFLEKKMIYACDSVIVVSDSIKEWYENEYQINNVTCIYNAPRYVEHVEKTDYFRTYFNIPKSSLVFLYQGGLLKARGIDLLLETFSKLKGNYHIVFMGFGILQEKICEYSKEYTNIHFHPAVPQNELANYTTNADFCFSVLAKSSMNHDYCMPNKLLESMMYEVPIIVSNTKDQANFVTKNDVGYVLQNYDSESLKTLIENIVISKTDRLLDNIKQCKKKYSWEAQEEKLLTLYK